MEVWLVQGVALIQIKIICECVKRLKRGGTKNSIVLDPNSGLLKIRKFVLNTNYKLTIAKLVT